MAEDKQLRAEKIAMSSFEVGRNPLDSAGMDTDDEIWVENNPEYVDYIELVHKELVQKKPEPEPQPEEICKKIAEKGFEIGKSPFEAEGMDTDDEEWVDNNLEYIDMIKQIYQELLNKKR
jgi:hypothetical protein